MERDICFVCLAPITPFNTVDGVENRRYKELYNNFLHFAKHFLKIPTASCLLATVNNARNSFCQGCTKVIKNISESYLELVQAKLRLSTKLSKLGGLLEGSKSEESMDKLRLIKNVEKLSEQLGIKGQVVTVYELRRSLEAKSKSG